MSAADAVQPFRFEATYNTSDVETAVARGDRPFRHVSVDRIFIALGIVGVLLLFWIYTIALGAAILAIATFAWGVREKSRGGQKRARRFMQPAETVRVGGNESEYWIEGDGFSARAAWMRVRTSHELGGYVLLRALRVPTVYLPIAVLQEAGAYEHVKAILDERHRVFQEEMAVPLRPVT